MYSPSTTPSEKACYFCSQNQKEIDWKNISLLRRWLSAAFKMKHRKKTGFCAKHQRRFAHAVKRARVMGILPILPDIHNSV